MERTVVALFDDVNAAEQALHQLLRNGFDRNDLSVMRTQQGLKASLGTDAGNDMTHTDGAASGAGIGAVLGGISGLVIGLGALTIPGIGPIVAAGPLAATLAGAGVGAAAGSIIGALTDIGIPEHEVGFYAEGLRRGATLLAVRADESQVSRATEILNNHTPVSIDGRTPERRASGSTGSEPDASRPPAPEAAGQVGQNEEHPVLQDDEWTLGSARPAGPAYDRTYDRTTAEMSRTFDMYDPDFLNDWEQTYSSSGYGYQRYRPAYEYGFNLATQEPYGDRRWDEIEPEAQRGWETQHPNDRWEDFKGAIEQAWQTVSEDVRGSR